MYAHVSREEWLFRGLAIAMCLAMIGLAVMPAFQPLDLYFEWKYGEGPNLLNFLELAENGAIAGVAAYYSVVYATTFTVALAGIVAAGIIITPALLA